MAQVLRVLRGELPASLKDEQQLLVDNVLAIAYAVHTPMKGGLTRYDGSGWCCWVGVNLTVK
jgi:hypothetical protein